jgi:hypothetical protein
MLATWKGETGRITVWGQPRQKVYEIPSQPKARHGGTHLSSHDSGSFCFLCFAWVLIWKKNHCLPQCFEVFSLYNIFIVLGLKLKSLIHFVLIFVKKFHSFACEYPVLPLPFNEDIISSVCSGTFLKKISWL